MTDQLHTPRPGEAELMSRHEPLVWHFTKVHRWLWQHRLSKEEAVQVCRLGLLVAIRKHDPTRGQLSTLTFHSTRTQIYKAIRVSRVVCLPHPMNLSELSEETVRRVRAADRQHAELFPEHRVQEDDVIDRLATEELAQRALRILPQRWRTILYMKFWDGLSMHEIARRFGVSYQAIQQIVTRALARMQKALEEEA